MKLRTNVGTPGTYGMKHGNQQVCPLQQQHLQQQNLQNLEQLDLQQSKPRKYLQTFVLTSIAVVAVIVFLTAASNSQQLSMTEGKRIGGSGSKKANAICSSVCQQRRTKRSESVRNANLLDNHQLVQEVSAAKERLLGKLREDYGDYFEPIFIDELSSKYRNIDPITEGGPSLERLKRKLMIKVLSMQVTLDQQDSEFHGCDCSGGKDHAVRNDAVESLDLEDSSALFEGIDGATSSVFEKYVWATGGHSASAGHGNLYNETYTSYMASDLKDVFGSIGIDFEGRNYAMGGTSSATAVSMCWKEIFGADVDFFSWDYGMTDGHKTEPLLHYGYRGAISPGRPAMMLLNHGGRAGPKRQQIYEGLEKMGVAAFYGNDGTMQVMRTKFPDNSLLTEAEINALPEYVRNYRCGAAIEKGDPYCGSEKFSKWSCSPRMKQSSWHPGFKDHAVVGHSVALFLMEELLSTLKHLSELPLQNATLLLSQLQQEDIELHNNFTNAELPDLSKNLLNLTEVTVSDTEPTINASLFFKGPSMCHTARLPSQTRYRGILTDTDEVGQPAPFGEETYFVGTDVKDAQITATKNAEMRLAYQVGKERETKCLNVTVKPDYPDFFYTNTLDGWTALTFPNDAEKKIYGYNASQHEGIFIIHWRACNWGKCPSGFLKAREDHDLYNWFMKINDQMIVKVVDIGWGGVMVKGEKGFRFAPDSNGQYKIEMKVMKENSYLQIADFVLY